MCRIFADYKDEIEKYCAENGLSVTKVFSAGRSYNNEKEHVFLQQFGLRKTNGMGLMGGNHPAPVTLMIFLENGKLRFVQTEHTYEHLAADRAPVPQMAFA
jgi:hypothetical protein